MDTSKYLSSKEAADILGVSPEHVQKLCRDFLEGKGGLRCEKFGGKYRATFFIDPESVKEYAGQVHKRGWKKGQPRKKESDQ